MITNADINKFVLLKIERYYNDNGVAGDRHILRWENLGFRLVEPPTNEVDMNVIVVDKNGNWYFVNKNSVKVID